MGVAARSIWRDLVEEARWYPSPHNSQPIKLRPLTDSTADLFYDLDLGLPAESYGIPFGHVCAGVFLESLAVVAAAHGFRVVESLEYDEMDFTAHDRLHRLGSVALQCFGDGEAPADTIERLSAFRARRTSRRPYDATLVDRMVIQGAAELVAAAGHDFRTSADKRLVSRVVRINQATLFADLRNDAVHAEIMQWLRFTPREAATTGDGLSAETMLLPGRVLKFAMSHRRLWSAPIIGAALRGIYLRTMRGVRQLGWIEGPFAKPADYVEAGRTFMRIWLYLTTHNVHLHPFGTVITNPRAHADFAHTVGANEGNERMAWMLFRFGHSKVPPAAHRRPASAMLLEPVGPEGTA